MNIEWLKNKTKEKFYPITYAKAVLFGNSNKTLDEEINGLNSNKLDKTTVDYCCNFFYSWYCKIWY